MSNWYKKATLGNDLTFVITTWLRNAKDNPQLANANDDISYQMGGADNEQDLSAAITVATSIVSSEQEGQLTVSQQEFIHNLRARNSGNQQEQDPMALNSMNNPTQINNLENPDNETEMPRF